MPSLPHIEMTLACLREHGVDGRVGGPDEHLVGAPHADPRHRRHDRARPVQRRTVPDAGDDQPGPGDASRAGRADHQAGDALRDLLGRMGAEVTLDDDGLTVTGGGASSGIDADLHDVGELAPAVAALCALASTPSRLRGIAHIRGHETDRLAALPTELRDLGAAVTEHPDGLSFEPASTARRHLPHLCRPPDGARGRGRRLGGGGRTGRGRRHHREDVPRLRRGLGGAVSVRA